MSDAGGVCAKLVPMPPPLRKTFSFWMREENGIQNRDGDCLKRKRRDRAVEE